MKRGGFDVILLTKTKISTAAYCRNWLGYEVTCLTVQPSRSGGYQGGVGLVTIMRPLGWGIESMRYHGPDVVSCELVTGITQTPLVGANLTPSIMDHLHGLEEALKQLRDPIVLRELNVDLDEARIPWSQQVADFLEE